MTREIVALGSSSGTLKAGQINRRDSHKRAENTTHAMAPAAGGFFADADIDVNTPS